jgi:hypothetical protein
MTVLGTYRGNIRNDLGFLNVGGRPDPDAVFHRANLPRFSLDDVAAAATGVMLSTPLYLCEGDLITNLTFISGATAMVTPTNWWFALYNGASAFLAQTADQTSAAWAADTVKTLALTAPWKITKSGVYWPSISITAATVPTLVGCGTAKPVLTGEINMAQTSGSGLTTTAPATIVTPAWKRQAPLVLAT